MPTQAEQLTVTSSREQIQSAVSDCVSQMLSENSQLDQKQAVAI